MKAHTMNITFADDICKFHLDQMANLEMTKLPQSKVHFERTRDYFASKHYHELNEDEALWVSSSALLNPRYAASLINSNIGPASNIWPTMNEITQEMYEELFELIRQARRDSFNKVISDTVFKRSLSTWKAATIEAFIESRGAYRIRSKAQADAYMSSRNTCHQLKAFNYDIKHARFLAA
ncbi:hypothetical protein [Roseibium alexandrii]|uniref:Uncharacterized protein n=1 Tax=Roseibium alexandrii TaxID=388408 RepID=A0A0M7ARV5_9HYPH|nr:hypothetical protein [Roseibium alexandrii]CTQ77387.1 hypothetical protein LAX5112_04892 [Roseibium alexandrii]